jgi:hypothetical protein
MHLFTYDKTILALRLFLGLLMCRVLYWGVFDQTLWFDESGQYWMSLGQSHFSPPLTSNGSLLEVWQRNIDSNLDPGGFTFLLRWWIKLVGSDLMTLRVFPSLFLILFLGIVLKFNLSISASKLEKVLSYLFVMFLMTSPMILNYGFEIRAYSYSLALSTLLIVLSISYFKKPFNSYGRALWLLSGLLAIFGRYSSIPIILACIVVTTYSRKSNLQKLKNQKKLWFSLDNIVGMILMGFMTLTYIFVTREQNNQSGKPPKYVDYIMLKDKSISESFRIVVSNFYSLPGMLLLSLLVISSILILTGNFKKLNIKWQGLAWIYLLSTILEIILSLVGLLPWSLNTRWSIENYSFVGLSLLFITQNAVHISFAWKKQRESVVATICSMALLFSILGIGGNLSDFRSNRGFNVKLMDAMPNETVEFDFLIVDDGIYPDLRFYIENEKAYSKYLPGWNPEKVIRFNFESGKLNQLANLLAKHQKEHILLLLNASWDGGKEKRVFPILKENGFEIYKEITTHQVLGWTSWIR